MAAFNVAAAVAANAARPARRWLQDRERIPVAALYLLLALAVLPLFLAGTRVLALVSSGPLPLFLLGEWLNQVLSLDWISYRDRDVVLYILLLPLAALLTVLTRLTLGVRVLGFRAILIAIGFQEIGLLPCLLLIALISGTVVLVRPLMRRFGLPLYARVAVILCIVAFTMLFGLFAGSWLASPTLWSMAFFPVVILAMLAESVADTAAREGVSTAVWRMASTIALAGVIAGISQLTVLRELLMACPELLLTLLVLIVLVSEFLDLRLFEHLQRRSDAPAQDGAQRPLIAVVRNRFPEAPPRRAAGSPSRRYRRAALQPLIDALRGRGFAVRVLECDSTLPAKLIRLAAECVGRPHGGVLVFNCAGGTQGAAALAQVPTLCEMLGLKYTGPGPQAPALLDDRRAQLDCLQQRGLQVPAALSYGEALEHLQSAEGPVWVRPRVRADRGAAEVRDARRLAAARERVQRRFGEVLYELPPEGRVVTAVVLHPERGPESRVLPLLASRGVTPSYVALADVSQAQRRALEFVAAIAAATLGCRDWARVDMTLGRDSGVTVMRVLAIDPITRRGAIGAAARLADLRPEDIAETMLRAAAGRDNNSPPSRPSARPEQVSLSH